MVLSQSTLLTNPFQPNALISFLFLIHGFHNETGFKLSHAQPNEKKPHMLGGWGQQVYINKCTELGSREGRRGAAGACQDIYTADVAFLQSAGFRCCAALLTLP